MFRILHIHLKRQKDTNSHSECSQGSHCEKYSKGTVIPLEPTPYLAAAAPPLAFLTNKCYFFIILTPWERSFIQILVTFSIPRATLNRVFLDKPVLPLLIKKILEFYKTLRLNTLILFFHPRLCIPSGILPSGFPTKTLYATFPSPSMLHAPIISIVSILSAE